MIMMAGLGLLSRKASLPVTDDAMVREVDVSRIKNILYQGAPAVGQIPHVLIPQKAPLPSIWLPAHMQTDSGQHFSTCSMHWQVLWLTQ